jgi:hypothetical protein
MKKITLITTLIAGSLFSGCCTTTYYQTQDGTKVLEKTCTPTCNSCNTCEEETVYDNRLPTETLGGADCSLPKTNCNNSCSPTTCSTKVMNSTPTPPPVEKTTMEQGPAPTDHISQTPGLLNKCIITVEATGIGVAPSSSISPAQSTAMARRAAIIDGYKALTEKLYGIKVNGRETVRNMVLQNSNLRAKIAGIIRGAVIEDEEYKNGMYKVSMSLKLNVKNWNQYLKNNPPYAN